MFSEEELEELGRGYEAAANALVDGTVKAFNQLASDLGVTGFQAGWAALQIYAKLGDIEGPFGIVRAEHAVFPQYDEPAKVRGWIENDWADWIRLRALELLLKDGDLAAVEVRNHWERLARGE